MEIQMKDKKVLLWLDDIRNPFSADWVMQFAPEYLEDDSTIIWVKNFNEFTNWITKNGLPNAVGFDHDLNDFNEIGVEKTGMDCAKWLIDYCMDNDVKLYEWFVQSANPAGVDNINGILNNYKKFQQKN